MLHTLHALKWHLRALSNGPLLDVLHGWTPACVCLLLQVHVHAPASLPCPPLFAAAGETWQGQLEGGAGEVFMEQISHHPPVSAFILEGPGA